MSLLPRSLKPIPTAGISAALPARRLKVLQFNTLADALSDAFPLVPKPFLSWEHRRGLLLQEILAQSPDLVSLQEVDHFEDFFEPELGKHGYDGLFKPKRDDRKSDGCATFYKRDKLALHIRQDLAYRDHLDKEAGQVALLSVFKWKDAEEESSPGVPLLALLNTHLKAKHDMEQLRVREIAVVGSVLDKLRKQYPAIPIVIASDMNTEPSGPVYEYLSKGAVEWEGSASSLSVPFKSAYGLYKDGGGEPEYTTWKIRPPLESCRVIDYLWYTPDVLRPVALLEIPPPSAFPDAKLPSENYPSDHLSLVAEFELC